MVVIESFSAEMKEKKISFTVNSDPASPVISADRSQMEQVFTNIIKNSLEAVDKNGQILITTTTNPVSVKFEDTGTGLTKDVSERIFTPFFSTKPGGQGIGLTLVHEILTNHGFPFIFRNKKDKGTEFIIKLKQEV
jgi:signal transduction histidine kinase